MKQWLCKTDSSIFFRFQNAVESLVVGEGDVRSRLYYAYLSILPIPVNELPEEFRIEMTKCTESITRLSSRWNNFWEDKNQGDLAITLKRIKNKTAARMAQLIFDIFVYLVHEQK